MDIFLREFFANPLGFILALIVLSLMVGPTLWLGRFAFKQWHSKPDNRTIVKAEAFALQLGAIQQQIKSVREDLNMLASLLRKADTQLAHELAELSERTAKLEGKSETA